MNKIKLYFLGLIPTIVVFMFSSPILGLVIGIIMFCLLSIIWWIWAINVISLINFISEKYSIDTDTIKNDLVSNGFRMELLNTLNKCLRRRGKE